MNEAKDDMKRINENIKLHEEGGLIILETVDVMRLRLWENREKISKTRKLPATLDLMATPRVELGTPEGIYAYAARRRDCSK